MGKLYPFNASLVDHNNNDAVLVEYGRVVFPIGVCDGQTVSSTDISSNYNFFTAHMVDDVTFLGSPYFQRTGKSNPITETFSQWLPNSPLVSDIDYDLYSNTSRYFIKLEAASGNVLLMPALPNGSGSLQLFKNGAAVTTITSPFWINLYAGNSKSDQLLAPTVDDMESDGTIPATANFYQNFCSLNVGTPSGRKRGTIAALSLTSSVKSALINWLNEIEGYTPGGNDPYTPGEEGDIDGPSGPGGGGGDHDTTSDPIDVPSLPTTSAVDTGFITLFNPSLAEIRALADYMWNGLFDINNLRKLFADPMDVILGLSIVPGPVPSGAQEAVSIGNISTGVMMTKAADQFFTVDCGTLKPTEFWGAYLDYSPYTKVDIYLPFIGMRSLSIDDVMEKNVNVIYHVDILSGACVAFIKSGDQVLYTHIGQCASSIPINGNDWTNTINGILSMAAAIAGTVATGGAAAPMLINQAANVTNILKPSVARSGGMGGMGGMLGIQKPYLILTRPRQCVPGNQNIYKGYPAFMTRALGDLSGMTSVEDIHLAVAGATQEELEEIERLLKEGVML